MQREFGLEHVTRKIRVVVADDSRTALEAATQLRKAFPELRILIFTELNGLSLRAACLQSGADGFVEKSQMPEGLMEEVRRVFPENPRID